MSEPTNLPARFEPAGPPEETSAKPDVPEMPVTEEEAISIIREMGGIGLPPEAMTKAAKLGVYVAQVGMLRFLRGKVFIAQAQAEQMMAAIATTIQEGIQPHTLPSGKKRRRVPVRELKGLTDVFSDLFKALTESQRMAMESSGSKSAMAPKGGDDSPPTVRTFRQGETVQPPPGSGRTTIVAQHVHITEPANAAKQ